MQNEIQVNNTKMVKRLGQLLATIIAKLQRVLFLLKYFRSNEKPILCPINSAIIFIIVVGWRNLSNFRKRCKA